MLDRNYTSTGERLGRFSIRGLSPLVAIPFFSLFILAASVVLYYDYYVLPRPYLPPRTQYEMDMRSGERHLFATTKLLGADARLGARFVPPLLGFDQSRI